MLIASKHYRASYTGLTLHVLSQCASGTLDLAAQSGDFFVGVLYRVGVGSDLPRPAQIGRVVNYAFAKIFTLLARGGTFPCRMQSNVVHILNVPSFPFLDRILLCCFLAMLHPCELSVKYSVPSPNQGAQQVTR